MLKFQCAGFNNFEWLPFKPEPEIPFDTDEEFVRVNPWWVIAFFIFSFLCSLWAFFFSSWHSPAEELPIQSRFSTEWSFSQFFNIGCLCWEHQKWICFLSCFGLLGYNTWTKIYDCHICCTDHCDCNGNQLNWSHCHSQSEVGHVNKRLICSLLFRCDPVGVPQHEMRNAWSVCYRCASAMIQKSDFKWSWKVPCRQRIEEYSCRPLISRTQWRLDATEKLKV